MSSLRDLFLFAFILLTSAAIAVPSLIVAESIAEPAIFAPQLDVVRGAPIAVREPKRAKYGSVFQACRSEIVSYGCIRSSGTRSDGTAQGRRNAQHSTLECLNNKKEAISSTTVCYRWLESEAACAADSRKARGCDDEAMLKYMRSDISAIGAPAPLPAIAPPPVDGLDRPPQLSSALTVSGDNKNDPTNEKRRRRRIAQGRNRLSALDAYTRCLIDLPPSQLSSACRDSDYYQSLVFTKNWLTWRATNKH